MKPGGGGRYSWEFLGGGLAARLSKSWLYFRPKNVVYHTSFQTRPLKYIPVFRPGLKAKIMSSLLKLEGKKKSSNVFRIAIFLIRSYSFGIETIKTFIRSRSSLENHTSHSRPKWSKCIVAVFRPKRSKNQCPLGRHIYTYSSSETLEP